MSARNKLDLTAFKEDALMSRQWQDDADHDLEAVRQAERDWAMGQRVAEALYVQKDPVLRHILAEAAECAAVAVQELVEVNFDHPEGVAEAKRLQSEAIRYRELVEWLHKAIAIGTEGHQRVMEARDEGVVDVNTAEIFSNGVGSGGSGETSGEPGSYDSGR